MVGAPLTRAKRVLIYGINYNPEPTGVGRYTADVGAYLSRHGVDVEVITAVPHYPGWVLRNGYRNQYRVETINGAYVTRCPIALNEKMHGIWRVLAPLSFAITSTPIAIWRILRTRPDAILCIEPTLFSAPLALMLGKLTRSRMVLHVQDLELDAAFAVGHLRGEVVKRLGRCVEARLLASFDHVVTISQAMRRKLEKKKLQNDQLSVIRNWVDVDKIHHLDRRSSYRDELGLSDDAFVVQYAGNIGAKQALAVILNAAAKLVDRPDIIFVIAGEGPDKARLESRYGHLKSVRFMGIQPEARLCEFLNLADLHVIPQMAGAADLMLPSKLGGMLASGKPVLVMASMDTELAEFLNGVGIVVPAGDTEALVAAIRSQRENPAWDLARAALLVQELSFDRALSTFFKAILPNTGLNTSLNQSEAVRARPSGTNEPVPK